MLLQQIVALLDAELDRLRTLRSIVSGLSATGLDAVEEQTRLDPAPVLEAAQETVPPLAASVPPVSTHKPRRSAMSRRSAPRGKKPADLAPALRGPIPNAPVVVHRDVLQSENARRQQVRDLTRESKPKEEYGSLGAMIRALRPEPLG